MASLINPPLLDKTGKEIVAALTGEEVQPSASQINAPISDATGKAILEAIKQGGGGGGANVLTLYAGEKDGADWAYKNPELTEEYETYEEAYSALNNADVIIIIPPVGSSVFKGFGMTCSAIVPGDDSGFVGVKDASGPPVYLWKEASDAGPT